MLIRNVLMLYSRDYFLSIVFLCDMNTMNTVELLEFMGV